MCLFIHVYACSTRSHASIQQRSLPPHRFPLSAKICAFDAVSFGLPSETACNPGRIRDLALFSPSVQSNLLHCTQQEAYHATRDGCRAPVEALQAAPQAVLDRQSIAYRRSDHHMRPILHSVRIHPFFFRCSINQSESARDMTSQPGYDLSPSNLMRIGHVCVCACGCLHVQACRLLLFMIFCSCCCRTCCSFLQTRHVMCFAPKELK